MRKLVYLSNVVTLKLDQSKCNGCGMCAVVCPHAVFSIVEGKATIISRDYCMECGACEMNCSEKAISVRSGVGCAAGIIAGLMNNTDSPCACSVEGSKCC